MSGAAEDLTRRALIARAAVLAPMLMFAPTIAPLPPHWDQLLREYRRADAALENLPDGYDDETADRLSDARSEVLER